ncbi:MAG: rhodanese [Desulfobulbaceae bacterium]|uniref:Rhodanese n=1 Tax=Candidatus Desulfatifera sulfidica TaxID=2841691 RepID=A0A8J6N5H8_9BACT|nr:rhodanese [Candidatus Desulfatifera sulfidica]
MSTSSAGLAKKAGYTNVRVYLDGEPHWVKDEYPVYASNKFVATGNIVLIDLRSAAKSAAGRIPRSVSIAYDDLEDRIEDIPKKAPIVLYSDNAEEAEDGISDLRYEGFKKVSLVKGNIQGWTKSGGAIEKGPVVTDIKWIRKLGKGEVALASFNKAASGQDAGAIVLDVRTKDEVSGGKFKNAVAIPLDELGSRLSELPKDKKIYVHCTSGARADMAAQELNKNGFKASFLIANVNCEGNDCTVED